MAISSSPRQRRQLDGRPQIPRSGDLGTARSEGRGREYDVCSFSRWRRHRRIYKTTNLLAGTTSTWNACRPPRTAGHVYNIRLLEDGTSSPAMAPISPINHTGQRRICIKRRRQNLGRSIRSKDAILHQGCDHRPDRSKARHVVCRGSQRIAGRVKRWAGFTKPPIAARSGSRLRAHRRRW